MVDLIKKYAQQKATLLKLEAAEKSSLASGNIAIMVMIAFFSIFFISLLNLGIAFLIGEYLDNYGYGFLIVAGFYLLIVLILIMAKSSIKKAIADKIVQSINK